MFHFRSTALACFTCSFLLLSASTPVALAGDQPSDLVVFGDSLSDNGNLYAAVGAPAPPYWEGRFSNGPVWVERLAPPLGLDPESISDFAMGGATTEAVLLGQVGPYLAAFPEGVPDTAIYVVWAGGNDLLSLVADPSQDPIAVIGAAVTNLSQAVGALALSGATQIVVPNLPNIASTPLVTQAQDPALVAQATALSLAFNDALANALSQVEALTGVDLIELDTFQWLADVTVNPTAYDLENVTDPALAADGTVAEDVAHYLWWDEIHPSAAGHIEFARMTLDVLGLPVVADATGDLAVTVDDLIVVIMSWGACDGSGPCPADLDGSGVVDMDDLVLVLEHWS